MDTCLLYAAQLFMLLFVCSMCAAVVMWFSIYARSWWARMQKGKD